MAYDIIGDVHGHDEALERLLEGLGYERKGRGWRHPDRHALFLGDLVDRGPGQLRAVEIARSMQEDGAATVLMGNHEFNAIGYATLASCGTRHLRERSERNAHQHGVFLKAVGLDTPVHREHASWFRTLPLWKEFPDFRAVHACWHPAMMADLSGHLDEENRLTEEGVEDIFTRGSRAYVAAEVVLKGLEAPLPTGVVYRDKDGFERRNTRIRWWDPTATDYRSASIVDEGTASQIPETPLAPEAMVAYDGAKPVFFGHYWMRGEPSLLKGVRDGGVVRDRVCLDFSVANGGHMTAYRHDTGAPVDDSRIVAVPAEPVPAAALTR